MATDKLAPLLLTNDAIQALLSSEDLPPATRITPIDTAPGYHHVFHIYLSKPVREGRIVSVKDEPTGSQRRESRPKRDRKHSPHSSERAVFKSTDPSTPTPTGSVTSRPPDDSTSHASRAGSEDSYIFVEKPSLEAGHTFNAPGGGSQHDIEPFDDDFEHLHIDSDRSPSPQARWHKELVLRISGNHVPKIKTRNEIGAMAAVKSNKYLTEHVPVPDIVAYSTNRENPIGCEYTLLAWSPGRPLRDIWDSLSQEQKSGVLHQLFAILLALHKCPLREMCGFKLTADGVRPAGIIDGRLWEAGDQKLWPKAKRSVVELNLQDCHGPWMYVAAQQVEHYLRLIRKHNSLEHVRGFLASELENFASLLRCPDKHLGHWKLNTTRYILAHRDLHFGNILYDSDTSKITAILGWEFAAGVPAPLWDPRKAFLWNGHPNDPDSNAKQRKITRELGEMVTKAIYNHKKKKCSKTRFLSDTKTYSSKYQYAMQELVNNLRAITEMCPRGATSQHVDDLVDVVFYTLGDFFAFHDY